MIHANDTQKVKKMSLRKYLMTKKAKGNFSNLFAESHCLSIYVGVKILNSIRVLQGVKICLQFIYCYQKETDKYHFCFCRHSEYSAPTSSCRREQFLHYQKMQSHGKNKTAGDFHRLVVETHRRTKKYLRGLWNVFFSFVNTQGTSASAGDSAEWVA